MAEDFTTFTEVDEGSDITVDSATKVSWVDLNTRQETGYLYIDKGVNHFAGDFTHRFEVYFSAVANVSHSIFWMLSNLVTDAQGVVDAGGDAHLFFLYDNSLTFYLRLLEDGAEVNDSWSGPQLATLYFVEIVRDDDGGANNTGRITAYIRTGSHTGALQDTLVVDCSVGEQNDFRYLYGVATADDGSGVSARSTGYTQNLDIGEAAAGWTGKIAGITDPAKINGVEVANIASVMGQ